MNTISTLLLECQKFVSQSGNECQFLAGLDTGEILADTRAGLEPNGEA